MPMITLSDKKAFSLMDLIISSALLIVLFSSALTGFVLLKQIFISNISRTMFQRDAVVIMSKILEGKCGQNGVRLSEAASVTFYSDAGKLTFIGTDGIIKRTYSLSGDSTSILYSDTNGTQSIMYTAPKGAIVALRFSPVNLGPTLCVSIYVSVSQVINGRTALGALESSVYLRNHSV